MAKTNSKKYRRGDLIVGAILDAAQRGATRTKIMYDAYISYYQCERYLHELECAGLLAGGEDRLWSTTDAGHRWLSLHRQMESLTIPAITT